MDKNQAYFVKCCQLFSSRLVHILVHARTGRSLSIRCSPSYDQQDYFSVRIEELGEVTSFLKENVRNFPPSSRELTVDFLMCIDGCYLPMESWCVSVGDGTAALARSFDMVDQNGDFISSFDSNKFSCELANLMKGVMAAARATPMFRYFIKKPEAERHVILYRVSEGPPIIELGEGQRHCHIGNVYSPYGSVSLDVFYRMEFETCKTSCCSRETADEKSLRRQAPSSKRSLEDDVGAYFPFKPAKRLSGASLGIDVTCEAERKSSNSGDSRKDSSPSRPSFYLDKSRSLSGDSNASSRRYGVSANNENVSNGSRSVLTRVGVPVPFFALLTASYTDACPGHQLPRQDEEDELLSRKSSDGLTDLCPDAAGLLEIKKGSAGETTIYESAASTVVLSPSQQSSGQDAKASNYSFLSSDDENIVSQTDNASENSFIKVPFALLPTGDPSNVGDFILFLRRCEMQEFGFSFDRTDLLHQQLAQFETRRQSFDRFLADITETIEV